MPRRVESTAHHMKNKIKLSVFFIARSIGVFSACRLLTRSRLRILCYHGGCIGDEHKYNPKLFSSSSFLAERMQWLKKKGFNIVSLEQATHTGTARAPLSTTITFDDGWYSTASEMIPVLGRLGIPSTLYLCTSHFNEGWSIPSVTVRYLIWKSGLLSAQLSGLGKGIDGPIDLSTPALRNEAANRIVQAIDANEPLRSVKHEMLEQVGRCLNIAPNQLALESRRFEYMNQQELLKLPAQGCSIELHGHIHNYPNGNAEAFKRDLQQCTDTIVAAGLPRPGHYCYPSGNFDAAASAVLSDMGIRSATTCLPGLVKDANPTQRHYLPRFLDGESISMLEFQAEMSGFTELLRNVVRQRNPLQPA